MARSEKPSEKSAPKPPQKRRWEPPRIKTGQLFESNSLACGKTNPMMETCLQNLTAS